ncbi:MAG: RHS repeat domain-containing protein [Desulfococcaceae bacterium]
MYDQAGNMTSRTDAENVTVTYDYDALNRLTDAHFPDSSQDISYGYDSGTYGTGRLTSVTDPAGITSFVCNVLGQITQETRTADGLTFETV